MQFRSEFSVIPFFFFLIYDIGHILQIGSHTYGFAMPGVAVVANCIRVLIRSIGWTTQVAVIPVSSHYYREKKIPRSRVVATC